VTNGTAGRIETARARIAEAAGRAGRDPGDVRLIAVTKGFEAEAVREAIAAGIPDVGESRVQEAGRKRAEIQDPDIRWHLIGHLQSNKAPRAANLFDAIHSLDSDRVAEALAERRDADRDPLAALVEVELTGIAGRAGVAAEGAGPLIRACIGMPGIHVLGLMTMAAPGGGDQARVTFRSLRELRDRVQEQTGWALPELSMGMSGDFEEAVEEGATMVRLGRTLFGERS
jgi:pyridoxal phosphate enzyme (YggS family)